MKKAVIDYPLGLLISIIVIALIVSYGAYELSEFRKMNSYQVFLGDVEKIRESIDYFKGSNSKYSFLNVNLRVPENQSIYFDNESDSLMLSGYFNNNLSVNADIINELFIEGAFDDSVVLCYYSCDTSKLSNWVVFE
jgi:hypothetical protein